MMIDRQLKLVQLFLNNQSSYLTSDEIATYLNVSNRTARNDIKIVNMSLLAELIISVKAKGYTLNTARYTIEDIEAALQRFSLQDSNHLVQLGYRLLMHHTIVTLTDLEQQFCFTKRELLDYLERLRMWCDKFEVDIHIKKRKGIIVEGSETAINNAILHLNQLATQHVRVEDLILNELPEAHVCTIRQIFKTNLQAEQLSTSDIQIEQLMIHLILIMKRHQSNAQSWHLNEEALVISRGIIEEINYRLGYDLNDDTSQLFSFFIGYHFNKFELTFEKLFIDSYIQQLILKMETKMHIPFSQDVILKDNLTEHFSRTYLRIIKEVYMNNPLTSEIKTLYPYVFNVLFDIVQTLSQRADITLSEDEIAFLTIHFQASIDRNEVTRVHMVICCYYGLGISQLLETKLTTLNRHIKVQDTLQYDDLATYSFEGVDVLVMTHDIDVEVPSYVDVIKISPLLSEKDQHQIQSLVKQKLNPTITSHDMSSIPIKVITAKSYQSLPELFDRAHDILMACHAVQEDYIHTALLREKASSTYIGHGVTMPHGDPDKVLKSHVLIFKHSEGFYWQEHEVKLVFFLAITPQDIHMNKQLMHVLAQLDDSAVEHLSRLDEVAFKQEIFGLIQG
ncbi:MAG: BglG family transcription antiterminator [Staphylococcus lugdunensis]|nr:BglG family transcription antiterminator [Staphylococcus lugdunensis]